MTIWHFITVYKRINKNFIILKQPGKYQETNNRLHIKYKIIRNSCL